jgi:hypothetical protein
MMMMISLESNGNVLPIWIVFRIEQLYLHRCRCCRPEGLSPSIRLHTEEIES